jgi:transmembrane sensor
MQQEEIQALIDRYHEGKCTREEVAFLESWYNQWNTYLPLGLSDLDLGIDLLAIQKNVLLPGAKKVKLWPRIAVAAAAVAAIAFGVWFYTYEVASSRKAPRNDVAYKNDIAPGKNTATLTLANGQVIQLSDHKIGVIVTTNQLTYNDGTVIPSSLHAPDPSLRGGTTKQPPFGDEVAASRNAPRNDVMLTASTPRGGTYQIILPDGSKVWLNAASSLKFPSTFIGLVNREVELSGEAYLEIAKDSKHPFVVKTATQQVEVLGTHFNINAYADEGSTKTTLLEGSVKVSSLRGGTTRQPHTSDEVAASRRAPRNDGQSNDDRGEAVVIQPNQQAVLTGNSKQFKVQAIDPTEAIAWKNGNFKFNGEDIRSIMRKLERWYDIEVYYEGKVPEERYYGDISRYKNISEVLNMLEKAQGVHFKIAGRRVTIIE